MVTNPRPDRLEVFPAHHHVKGVPPSLHPHFVRRVASNGRTENHSESYVTRFGAVRAARKAAKPEGLRIHVLDRTGRTIRVIFAGDKR